MERYDRQDIETKREDNSDESSSRVNVQIDQKHQEIIKNLLFKELKDIEINGVKLIKSISHTLIVMNSDITLSVLSKELGKELSSKKEFIEEYYMYALDRYTDEAYGKKVTAIQEFPYSFQADQNEDVISYNFIS